MATAVAQCGMMELQSQYQPIARRAFCPSRLNGEKVAQFADATYNDNATERANVVRQIRLQALKEQQSCQLYDLIRRTVNQYGRSISQKTPVSTTVIYSAAGFSMKKVKLQC